MQINMINRNSYYKLLIYLKRCTHSYLISSTLNDLTSNSAIVPNTFTMSNYGSGQADSVAVIIGATLSSTLITCYSYPTPVVAPAVCSNSITRTDAQYFLDTIAYSGLSNNTFYSKPIVLKWNNNIIIDLIKIYIIAYI